MQYSYINPVRFYNTTKEVDWVSYYPYIDNQDVSTDYYNQFKALPFVKEVPDTFIIQAYTTGTWEEDQPYLKLFKNGSYTEKAFTIYGNYRTAFFSGLSDGIYQIKEQIPDNDIDIVSDFFIVKSGLTDTVKIQAHNSKNDYGVAFSNGVTDYTFSNIYIGNLDIIEGKSEYNQWTSDRGKIVNARSTFNNYIQANIEIHRNYMQHIKTVCACDTISINGQSCVIAEPPKFTAIEGTQLANCTIIAQLTPNYYYL